MNARHVRAASLATLMGWALAACGGGSTAVVPRQIEATPSPSPVASRLTKFPTPAAGSSTSTVAVGPSGAITPSLGVLSGVGGKLNLPATDQGATVTVVFTTGSDVPTGLIPDVKRRNDTPLPEGPYLADIAITPDHSITFAGSPSATYDIGPLLGTTQSAELAEIAALAPSLYAGLFDPSGNLTVAGPLAFNGTTVTANLSSNLTIVAGTTYHIALHLGPLTPITVATPTPGPVVTPTAPPSVQPTATPTVAPTATAAPTLAPTSTPTVAPTPTAMPTTAFVTQNIDAGGATDSASDAFILPSTGGYSASIGYPMNDSKVVTVNTSANTSAPPGAPVPSSGTVVYAAVSSFSGGAPNNQSTLTFTSNATTVNGVLDVPTQSGVYSVYVYAPALNGTNPIYSQQGLQASNYKVTFSSPLNQGTFTLPIPVTLDIEVTQ